MEEDEAPRAQGLPLPGSCSQPLPAERGPGHHVQWGEVGHWSANSGALKG